MILQNIDSGFRKLVYNMYNVLTVTMCELLTLYTLIYLHVALQSPELEDKSGSGVS